jgi:hypothetical protein
MRDPTQLKTSPHAVYRLDTKLVAPPQNHSLRNATATTTDVSIDFLQHSSPGCIGPTTFHKGRLTVGQIALDELAGCLKLPWARLAISCTNTAENWPRQRPASLRNPIHSFRHRGEERLRVEAEIVGKPSAAGWSRRKVASIRR